MINCFKVAHLSRLDIHEEHVRLPRSGGIGAGFGFAGTVEVQGDEMALEKGM